MTLRAAFPYILILGLGLLLQAMFVLEGITPVLRGELFDTDSYMWLMRTEALVTGVQGWFENSVPRMNTPYGDVLNWSRPTDMVIIALALPFRAFMDWHEAIFWGGAIMAPLFYLLIGLALVWTFAPLAKPVLRLFIISVALIQPPLLAYTMAGRPDHHPLIILSIILYLGHFIRLFGVRDKPKQLGLFAGFIAGVGLWVSVEFQITLAVLVGLTALMWLISGRAHYLIFLVHHGLGLVFAVALALLIERGGLDLGDAALDKISWVHAYLVSVNALIWLILARFNLDCLWPRFLSLGGLGFLALAAIILVAPRALMGPTADMDPEVYARFFVHIREMRTLLPDIYLLAFIAGTPLLAVGLLPLVWQRFPLAVLPALVISVVFTFLAVLHARFAMMVSPIGAALLVLIAYELFPRSLLRVTGVILLPFMVTVILGAIFPQSSHPQDSSCEMGDYVREKLPSLGAARVMATLNMGPELLYFSGVSTVAGPYHRNRDGILDSLSFFEDVSSGKKAEEISSQRGIDYVLVCKAEFDSGSDNFGWQLAKGRPPAWLKEEDDKSTAQLRLYRVLK